LEKIDINVDELNESGSHTVLFNETNVSISAIISLAPLPKFFCPSVVCPCLRRPRLLVVDDNIFNIFTLQNIIDISFGIATDKALNGEDAIE
jgi:hypothetical protein